MIKGKISKELLNQYRVWSRESDKLSNEMELFLEQRKRQVKEEFDEKFEDLRMDMENRKDELWDMITKELNLNPDEPYHINQRNGEIIEENSKYGYDEEDEEIGIPIPKEIVSELLKGGGNAKIVGVGEMPPELKGLLNALKKRGIDSIH